MSTFLCCWASAKTGDKQNMHTTYTNHCSFMMLYTQKLCLVYVCVNFQHSCTTPKPWKLKYKQKRYFTWLQLLAVHVHKEKKKQITFDFFLFFVEHLFYKKTNSAPKICWVTNVEWSNTFSELERRIVGVKCIFLSRHVQCIKKQILLEKHSKKSVFTLFKHCCTEFS